MLVRCRGPREEGLLFTLPEDIRQVGFDGRGPELGEWTVPTELPIHAEILRSRPDVDVVVHCHPPSVLAAALAGVELRPIFGAYNIPAARMALDGIPVYPRKVLVRSTALGRELVDAMGSAPVCVLAGHGIATVGSGEHAVEQAVVRALNLDALARVNVEQAGLGGHAADLASEDVAELPDLGSSFNDLNLWRHHVARLRLAGLDLA